MEALVGLAFIVIVVILWSIKKRIDILINITGNNNLRLISIEEAAQKISLSQSAKIKD